MLLLLFNLILPSRRRLNEKEREENTGKLALENHN